MSKSGNLVHLGPILSSVEPPSIYYAEDYPYLPRILIFYWPIAALGSLSLTSRVRISILSAAGFKSYPPTSIAPSSPFYSAVYKLPDDKQRDEVCRAITFMLCKYFSEVASEVKNAIQEENIHHGPGPRWGQSHAAQVACKMSRVTNVDEVVKSLRPFLKEKPVDVAISPRPVASIRRTRPSYLPPDPGQPALSGFGRFTTPSKRIPSGSQRSPSSTTKKIGGAQHKQNVEQLENLRFKMCEFVDTEDRYINRLNALNELVSEQGRTAKSLSTKYADTKTPRAINAMLQFPALVDQIRELNLAFLDDIESALQSSEEAAMSYIEQSPVSRSDVVPAPKDPIGVYAFAKVMLHHFPKFPVPYRTYLDLHSQISSNLDEFFRDDAQSKQTAPSLLMEPAQRISRYGLYIDSMIPQIPPSSSVAIRVLEKARKIIAEICELEPAASTILDSVHITYEAQKRSLSPSKLLAGITRANTVKEAPAKSIFASMTGSLRGDRESPRLLPSLSRSFSKKNRSRPGLTNILSEQDAEQAQNRSRYEENMRPKSSSSGMSLRGRLRPGTSSSQETGELRPSSKGQLLDVAEENPSSTLVDSPTVDASFSAEHYTAQVMKLEQENYRLLAENAELKRLVRECRCGKLQR